jgi:hypothetical protein
LVDRLLGSEDFVRLWTYRLATLMRVRSQPQDQAGAARFHQWLGQQLRAGTAYDEMVRQLLTAEGDTHEIGPANFYRVAKGAREQAEYVSELLMGARLRCANCHNHPLDRWTQDDYHGLAALFARVEPGRVVRIGARGSVSHPKTGQPARPRIPGERFLDDSGDPREALADWLTDADNPYFATAIVNRLWRFLMGRGLIEPPDDVRSTNPPSHPELLRFLADDFREHSCDIRWTLRTIALSAAYARNCKPPRGFSPDRTFYSHAIVRPLAAEVLADAIADVTGVPERYPGHPVGTRAVALFDPGTPAPSLDVLGRCSREQSCEVGSATTTLTQWLHMLNGGLVNERIRSPDGRLRSGLDADLPDDTLIREFYAVALSRPPTAAEADFWRGQLQGTDAPQRRDVLEDFVWSLLVCREFVTNH